MPFSCYSNDSTRQLASLQAPKDGTASNVALGEIWAQGTNYAQACYAQNGENGSLIGTSFAARDTIQVLDALRGKDALLNYWGKSHDSRIDPRDTFLTTTL